MREVKVELSDGEDGQTDGQYEYVIVVEELEQRGFYCESYGIRARERDTGWCAEVQHVTTCGRRINGLLALLAAHQVAPCHLRAVIEDWL